METMNLRKDQIKGLISEIIQIDRRYMVFLHDKNLFDYIDFDFGVKGFKINFSEKLPEEILKKLVEVLKKYTN